MTDDSTASNDARKKSRAGYIALIAVVVLAIGVYAVTKRMLHHFSGNYPEVIPPVQAKFTFKDDVVEIKLSRDPADTRIIVGLGTCGIAAGAREVMQAILKELHERRIEAHVETVGCIGLCAREPLVDIEQAGQPRVSYGNMTPEKVPRLIEEHLTQGRVVEEWVVGRLDERGVE